MTSVVANQFLPLVATAAATTDSIVVSVHDVAPHSRDVTEKMIIKLAHHGVPTCSLLVVPDYRHQGLATKDRQFVSWLRDLQSAGYEIVIHGYFTYRARRGNESVHDKFFFGHSTADLGEIYVSDYDRA